MLEIKELENTEERILVLKESSEVYGGFMDGDNSNFGNNTCDVVNPELPGGGQGSGGTTYRSCMLYSGPDDLIVNTPWFFDLLNQPDAIDNPNNPSTPRNY